MNTSALRVPVEQSTMVAIPGLADLYMNEVAHQAEILVLDDDPQTPWAPGGEILPSGVAT